MLVESLLRRKVNFPYDNLILDLPFCGITHHSFSFFLKLLAVYPIIRLYFTVLKFEPVNDVVSSDDDHTYLSMQLSNLQLLSEMFTSDKTLTVLDISLTEIGPEGAALFANLRNLHLYNLRMAGCKLGPKGADKIGEMLYHNKSVEYVDLSGNDFMDIGTERLVHHLKKNNQLQHLDLGTNEITEIGAEYLSALIANDHTTLTSIELSANPLKHGVFVFLSSLNFTLEHIGLSRIDISSSCPIIASTFHKAKSISFDLPDDCDLICDSLANTSMLKLLEICINSESASHQLLNAIRQNSSIEILKLDYRMSKIWVPGIIELVKHCETLTELSIMCSEQSPQDVLQIADSLMVNNSIKSFKYRDMSMDQATAIKFLEKLKQAYTIEQLILQVSAIVYNDYWFLEDVEECVKQINHIRSVKGVSKLLKVEICLNIISM